jgi:hypothetical protein
MRLQLAPILVATGSLFFGCISNASIAAANEQYVMKITNAKSLDNVGCRCVEKIVELNFKIESKTTDDISVKPSCQFKNMKTVNYQKDDDGYVMHQSKVDQYFTSHGKTEKSTILFEMAGMEGKKMHGVAVGRHCEVHYTVTRK